MSKLSYHNNWCSHEYSVDGVMVTPQLVEIHFKGEDLGTFDVLRKYEQGSYSDHGHTYSYSTLQYFASIDSPFGQTHGPTLNDLITQGYDIFVIQA